MVELKKSWKSMPEGDEKYGLYLASREWGLLRQAVIRRAGGKCEECHERPVQQVHHLTYIRKYNELLSDLQGLCRKCHKYKHGITDEDPKIKPPPMFLGAPVKSIYLAGSCGPDMLDAGGPEDEDDLPSPKSCRDNLSLVQEGSQNWRALITDAYFCGHREQASEKSLWVNNVRLFRSQKDVRYTGPYIEYDHGCMQNDKHGANYRDRDDVAEASIHGIREADLVFGWIDCEDCYGTIAELGYARAIGKKIIIAGPQEWDEMWFVYRMADATKFDEQNPREALEHFVK